MLKNIELNKTVYRLEYFLKSYPKFVYALNVEQESQI